MSPTESFRRARDLLFSLRDDHEAAHAKFRWPDLDDFNWAFDWFDVVGSGQSHKALTVVGDGGESQSLGFDELSDRSRRVARYMRDHGVKQGDRVLVMLSNVVPLWETMLAAIRLGAVIIPATTQLTADDIDDRVLRGGARHMVTDAQGAAKLRDRDRLTVRLAVGGADGFAPFDDARNAPSELPRAPTRASDPLLLYFTSGTTAKPKLVLHTHASYPVGHLSTMYWIGLREGDVHQNISSPGWAKHAWSSFFAPWNAGATVLAHDPLRFAPNRTLEVLRDHRVNTLCAPPTVWRMLIVHDLGAKPAALRELVSAGEPLNPEVIDSVTRAWGLTVRDGYGQTETTAQVGNSPGLRVKPGSMGKPLPGYDVILVDGEGREVSEGEVALRLSPRPLGLMRGYMDDAERTAAVVAGGVYRTGDEALRDDDGYIHFVGRGDDVFKSSDYRISPFELESALVEHEAVAEAAVVPSPDPLRLSVPKAFVALRPGVAGDAETARAIFEVLPTEARAVQAHSEARIRDAAEDDLREDPARGAPQDRGGAGGYRAPAGRVLPRRRLSLRARSPRSSRRRFRASSTASLAFSLLFPPAMKTTLMSLVGVALLACACHSNRPAEGPAERAGQKVDNAAQDTKDAAHDTKEDVKHDLKK